MSLHFDEKKQLFRVIEIHTNGPDFFRQIKVLSKIMPWQFDEKKIFRVRFDKS